MGPYRQQVVSFLFFFAPYTAHIPLCALATILLIIAFNMSDMHQFIHILYHAPWYDVVVLIITCALTVMVDLVFAVAFGSLIALLLFTLRMYQTTETSTGTRSRTHTISYHDDLEQVIVFFVPNPTCA